MRPPMIRMRVVNPKVSRKMKKYISNLSLRGKFLFVTLSMLVPLAVLCLIAARLEFEKISAARHEDTGLKWASELIAIAANLSEYREHYAAVAAGAENERSELAEHQGLVEESITRLDELVKDGERQYIDASAWQSLRPRVETAIEGDGGAASQTPETTALIADLHKRVQAVSELSGLILDPGADTFPLMFSALFDLPKGVESLASSRRAMNALVAGDKSVGTYMALASEVADARTRLQSAMHFLAGNYTVTATIESQIPAKSQELARRLDAAFTVLATEARQEMAHDRAMAVSNEIELLTEDLSELRDQANVELSMLLHSRATSSQWTLGIEIAFVLLGVALAYRVQRQVSSHITHKLEVANGAFGELAKGKFDNELISDSTDELGELLSALSNMQERLAARVEADSRAAAEERERGVATARIKQALDASSVNVVVCDEQFHVIYLNPAAQRLMSAAQSDFQRIQPRFDASRLVGANLEIFYQDGARQRDDIAAARQAVTSQSVVGSRTLVSTASPIVDADGKRIGTVVEWVERTQEVAAEKEIGDLVSAVSHGQLDQRISLVGKSGFFEVLANGLNGLVVTRERRGG